jgi:hypothetical protein
MSFEIESSNPPLREFQLAMNIGPNLIMPLAPTKMAFQDRNVTEEPFLAKLIIKRY